MRLPLAAVADQPPQVAAQLEGIGTAITPQARVPVAGRVIDDYGIGKVWFEYAVDQDETAASVRSAFPAGIPAEFKLDFPRRRLGGAGFETEAGPKTARRRQGGRPVQFGQRSQHRRGRTWLLDVVTPDQLQIMLKARELVLRQRFEAIIQETTETRDLLCAWIFPPASPSSPPLSGSQDKDAKKQTRFGR